MKALLAVILLTATSTPAIAASAPKTVKLRAHPDRAAVWISSSRVPAGKDVNLVSVRVDGKPLFYGEGGAGRADTYMYGNGVAVYFKTPRGKRWKIKAVTADRSRSVIVRYRIGPR